MVIGPLSGNLSGSRTCIPRLRLTRRLLCRIIRINSTTGISDVANKPVQNSLFEEDYLLRELGQLGTQPQMALTELVANAWDAGASQVALVLPDALAGC